MAGWRHRRRKRRTDGATAVEYALVLPALLLFVLGIIDVSRLLWTYTTLHRAVEAAARCGAVNEIDCVSSGQIQSYAAAQAWGMTITPGAFTVSNPACGVQVQANYDFTFIIPWMLGSSTLGLRATACYHKPT